jgi:hypothetical protein
MTTLLPPADALADSERLIAVLEQHQDRLPFAAQLLTAHRVTHHDLAQSHTTSERAVAAWRSALAQRWECEIAARRLYKQIVRQMIEYYGSGEAPSVRLLISADAGVEMTPAELLADLRRLQTVLSIDNGAPPFAAERLVEVAAAAELLEQSIAEASAREHERRTAVLDSRIARETYRRVRSETYRAFVEHYGDQHETLIQNLFG